MNERQTVFTNGCFDILHQGHVTYLNLAKSLGNYLIVGLNSDSSVKGLKGDKRPINTQDERKFILENLKAVDEVIIFSEQTPLNLIKEVRPQFLVKGGDWAVESIVGYDFVQSYGGKVLSLPFVEGLSTTNVIEKIKMLYK